jgi:hypothetical protein
MEVDKDDIVLLHAEKPMAGAEKQQMSQASSKSASNATGINFPSF